MLESVATGIINVESLRREEEGDRQPKTSAGRNGAAAQCSSAWRLALYLPMCSAAAAVFASKCIPHGRISVEDVQDDLFWTRCRPGTLARNASKPWYNPVDLNQHKWRNQSSSSCRKPDVFPFKVGCGTPSFCAARRPHLPKGTQFKRATLTWSFGRLESERSIAGKTHTQVEARFPNASALAHMFMQAEAAMLSLASKMAMGAEDDGSPSFLMQHKIHMNLWYFCCLTEDEVPRLQHVVKEWLPTLTGRLDIPVRFDRLECWQERPNSVTNILIAEDALQERLFQLNHELAQQVEDCGLELVVSREEQMPFHVTLIGMRNEDGADIQEYLPLVHDKVTSLTKDLRDRWMSTNLTVLSQPPIMAKDAVEMK